jgi:ATP:ADP antiporter, AAA family
LERRNWIYKALNLEKGEGHLVFLPTLYSFFTGVSLAYFVTSSTALFLSSFERDMLSVAFIAAGVTVWLIGIVFARIQKKFGFSKSLTISLGFLLVSIATFVGMFLRNQPLVLIFIIYAWIRVFAYIHAVTFWGLAGRLFSLRQGKRLFGLISGGEVIASIISFFSVPFLLKRITTEDLLIISGVTLLAGFFVMLAMVRKFSSQLSSIPEKQRNKEVHPGQKKTAFLQNRYYKLFFVIAFIPIFAQFFIDYIFQAQAKVEFPGKAELTAFVGIFFGLSSIVEFVLKSFVSGRLLSRYGMRVGLMAFPAVMAVSMLLASVFGLIYGALSLFFIFIALARLFTRAVRTSFNDPATQLLYQPLPPEERAAFQNKVESGPKAYASIFAGILLLIFAQIPGISLVYFALFMLLITFVWAFAAKEIYLEYRNTLQHILSLKQSNGLDKNTHPLLSKIRLKISSGDKAGAYALSRLSKIIFPFQTFKIYNENPEFAQKLNLGTEPKFSQIIELTKSENPNDRILSLRYIPNYTIYKVEKPLIRLLHDENFEVKCEAIIASAKMKEPEFFYHLVSLFQKPEYKTITSKAMVQVGPAIIPELDHNFQKTEYDINLQISTLDVAEKIGGSKATDFLVRNINHHNKSVSDKVIHSLGKLKYAAKKKESQIVWQKLENELKNYITVTSALLNLKNIPSADLIKSLESEKKQKKRKVFADLAVLYDPFAIQIIAESLDSDDKNSRGFAIEVADMVISEMHKPLLLPLFESETDSEMIQKYMLYFPTTKLGVVEQLTDLVHSEYWVIGLFAKTTALKLAAQEAGKKVMPLLMANIVHPRPIMWQMAAYCIYQIDKAIFEEEIYQNFPKVKGLKEFSEEIADYLSGSKQLIYDRLVQLKMNQLFADVPEDELVELATQMKIVAIEKGNAEGFEPHVRQFVLVLSGCFTEPVNDKKYGQGSLFCPWLQFKEEAVLLYPETDKVLIAKIDMHLINDLLEKHNSLADKLTQLLWGDV